MPVSDALSRRPRVLPPTLPLVRVVSFARGLFLADSPLYLASHWRLGRSFPCVAPLLQHCPWCAGAEKREHAYIPVLLAHVGYKPTRDLLELPPHVFTENTRLYGMYFNASRRSKRAPVLMTIEPRQDNIPTPPIAIDNAQVLRTLAKVYALPDPAAYETEHEWLLALQIRTDSPDYSPGRHNPRETTT
jgi:hypothetical protein